MTALRPGRPDEAAALTELTLRSKAHWGYDGAFLAAVRAELTVRPEQCDGVHLWVAQQYGVVAGYYLLEGAPPVGELANLFVEPHAIGTGIGGALMRDALARASDLGLQRLSIDADPGAEAFYLHHGAVRVATVPSGSIAGRVLPRLEISTAAPA